MPALPLDEAGKYVAATYLVFLVLILIYVAIMASKLDRMNRDLSEITPPEASPPASFPAGSGSDVAAGRERSDRDFVPSPGEAPLAPGGDPSAEGGPAAGEAPGGGGLHE